MRLRLLKQREAIDGWKYYNHAAIPTCAPHECPKLVYIYNGFIWHSFDRTALFARWTSDWDCGYKTDWWYTILDKPFDLMSVNSHYRNRIKKGLKEYECKRINPADYAKEMAYVTLRDWESYPKQFRPNISEEELIRQYANWSCITHGAFDQNGLLCAFHGIKDCGNYYEMFQGKSIPEKQKGQLNAALIYTYITDLSEDISKGKYISNGQRNLNHQTNFNNDLCKYYGFRKVYCKLHLKYRKSVSLIVKIAYPFRSLIKLADKYKLAHYLTAVLCMEEIIRGQE